MKTVFPIISVFIVAAFITALTINTTIARANGVDPVIEATQKGVDWILADAANFDNANLCFSCHVTAQAIRAAAFAERSPDVSLSAAQIGQFNTLLNRLYVQQFDGAGLGNGAVTHVGTNSSFATLPRSTSAWAFFGMSGIDPTTAANFDSARFIRGAEYLLGVQAANGSVSHDHFLAPVNIGVIMTTAEALHAWQRAFEMTNDGKFLIAVTKAKEFLLAATPVNASDGRFLGDATWIALGLTAAGVSIDDTKVQAMITLIKGRHIAGGGWSVRATSSSLGTGTDAFGTGVALCGLLAGRETESTEFQEGLQWILANQQADGGWPGAPIGSRSRVVSSTWATICLAAIQAMGFPEAGLDAFLSVAVFELGSPDGPMIRTPLLLDFNTLVERSDPGSEDDAAPETADELCSAVDGSCVHVQFPGGFGGVGRQEVVTELVSLNLVGGPFSVKAGQPALDHLTAMGKPELFTPSLGEVESLDLTGAGAPGTDFPADSFFDVFAVIDTPGGALFNKEPLIVVSRGIDQFPPIAFYPHESTTGAAIPLFSVDDPDGPPVTFLKRAVHGTRAPELIGLPVEDPMFEEVIIEEVEMALPPPLDVPQQVDFFRNSTALVGVMVGEDDPVTLILSGPTTIHVDIDDVQDMNTNSLDDVATEMVQLELTGNNQALGTVKLRLRDPAKSPFQRSTGKIEEKVNDTSGVLDVTPFGAGGSANSFFDVFFEVEVGGQILHAEVPSRMEGMISSVPPGPGDGYAKPEGIIPLFDENNNPTDVKLVNASHVPDVPPKCDADLDGNIDRDDISLIFAARGELAASFVDPRDEDMDGTITVNDGRACVLQCTNPRCAP